MKYGITQQLPAADADLVQRFHTAMLSRLHKLHAGEPVDIGNPVDVALTMMASWSKQATAASPAVESFTCWGLSSFCAEVGHKCRAARKCVYTPPNAGVRASDGRQG